MITIHLIPVSHPCRAAEAALRLKGVAHERIVVETPHGEQMAGIYGEGNTTVPGMLVDGEPVHGTRAIFRRLEELAPSPSLYPEPNAEAVREAELWGDGDFQDLGRRLPWGALHFRPEMFGLFGGVAQLDPAGTDFAIRFIRAGWKYHRITAVRLHEDLQALPGMLDRIDGYVEAGVVGGDEPTAADLELGATLAALGIVGDLAPLLSGRPCSGLGARWLEPYGDAVIPAGAFPAGWVPAA